MQDMASQIIKCFAIILAAVACGNVINFAADLHTRGRTAVVLFEEIAKFVIFKKEICARTPSGILPIGVAFGLIEGPHALLTLNGVQLDVLMLSLATIFAFIVPVFLHCMLATPYLLRMPLAVCFGISVCTHYLWNFTVPWIMNLIV
jgi:hypothetical protein